MIPISACDRLRGTTCPSVPGAEPLLVGIQYEAAKTSAAEMHGLWYEVAMIWAPLRAHSAESFPNPLGEPHFRQIAPNPEDPGFHPGERPSESPRARTSGVGLTTRVVPELGP
jgi:hypothetical protein